MYFKFLVPKNKYYKNKSGIRYYKYDSWVQPILTSNGTMGVSDFAVSASSEYDPIRQAYRAFDGSNIDSYIDCWHSDGKDNEWLSWFTKNPIKISSLTIFNRSLYNNDASSVNAIKGWELQVSNDDGNSWRTLKNGTNSNTEPYGSWTITIENTVQVFSNYWRLKIIDSNGTYICVGDIKINAIVKTPYEVSYSDDYDFYETVQEISDESDYDTLQRSEKTYKSDWASPVMSTIRLFTTHSIKSDVVAVNGDSVKTNAQGDIFLYGYYGETKSFYIQYGGWSKVVQVTFGGKGTQVTLNPNFQEVLIRKADGSLIPNSIVQVDGVAYFTDSNSKLIFYGEYLTSKDLFLTFDGCEANITIYYEGTITDVTLSEPSGSISVEIWNYSASDWSKKAFTFTVPNGINVMMLSGNGFDGWSDGYSDPAYVGTDGSSINSGAL